MQYNHEVLDALERHLPVVALESTIISHGMPYPQNLATAREVENLIRDAGAVPATIAVIRGTIRVGLDAPDLEILGSSNDVQKLSVRDLPACVASGGNGATTVAATMRIASMAGIRVFATGGTGGVHRGASETFDVSADLSEFATSRVAVISAGVKSILDIGATLEQLETLGVTVLCFGSDEFPAFYSRRSGYRAPLRVDSAADVARILDVKWKLGLNGGALIANPIPPESEIPASEIEPVIADALREMRSRGISGKDATPFMLARIVELTGGRSLVANIELVKNNARVASGIAIALRRIEDVPRA
jgi:pseudouridine-5'-phosphate glycosidase